METIPLEVVKETTPYLGLTGMISFQEMQATIFCMEIPALTLSTFLLDLETTL